ncbi:hypothetical protein L914_19025 [Phytophthora nicotianae]|nr:hypothetical protein L914_19025 [Phytophthora nicotianae]
MCSLTAWILQHIDGVRAAECASKTLKTLSEPQQKQGRHEEHDKAKGLEQKLENREEVAHLSCMWTGEDSDDGSSSPTEKEDRKSRTTGNTATAIATPDVGLTRVLHRRNLRRTRYLLAPTARMTRDLGGNGNTVQQLAEGQEGAQEGKGEKQ